MKDAIIFGSVVIYVAIVLEMYRISKLVKSQEKMIILQNEVINEYKRTELIYKEMAGNYEKLNTINDKIIANLKK